MPPRLSATRALCGRRPCRPPVAGNRRDDVRTRTRCSYSPTPAPPRPPSRRGGLPDPLVCSLLTIVDKRSSSDSDLSPRVQCDASEDACPAAAGGLWPSRCRSSAMCCLATAAATASTTSLRRCRRTRCVKALYVIRPCTQLLPSGCAWAEHLQAPAISSRKASSISGGGLAIVPAISSASSASLRR